jgi:hypothetical protein
LYFVGLLAGLLVAVVVWSILSRYVAVAVLKSEENMDHTISSKPGQAIEIVLCGILFLIALALILLIANLFSS